jgi:ribose transport system permease protein
MTLLLTRLRGQGRLVFGIAILFAVLLLYFSIHPRGASPRVVESLANGGTSLAFAAIAQIFPILTGGLDLSVGGIIALTNSVASVVVNGSPVQLALGIVLVLATGLSCGLLNGLLIVKGRLQPVIATLATGAFFSGLALMVRPQAGGNVDADLGEFFISSMVPYAPNSLITLVILTILVWYPLRRSALGRGMFAAGSAREAGHLSGLKVDRSIIAAYVFSGLFCAFAGLFLAFQALAGDPRVGVTYTINSIAAVVIGGIALRGGSGTVLSAIVGAFTLRTINSTLLFSGMPPLSQPFFEGTVLVVAIVFASLGLVRRANRLEALK